MARTLTRTRHAGFSAMLRLAYRTSQTQDSVTTPDDSFCNIITFTYFNANCVSPLTAPPWAAARSLSTSPFGPIYGEEGNESHHHDNRDSSVQDEQVRMKGVLRKHKHRHACNPDPDEKDGRGATTLNTVRNLDRVFWKVCFMVHPLRTHPGPPQPLLEAIVGPPFVYDSRPFESDHISWPLPMPPLIEPTSLNYRPIPGMRATLIRLPCTQSGPGLR